MKKPRVTPSLIWCLDDPHLFAPSFAHGDWAAWRVFIAALFAEGAPDEATLAIYRAHTGRFAWPSAPFSEAALIVGRGVTTGPGGRFTASPTPLPVGSKVIQP